MQTLILNHYPPVIRQIKEMQQIAKAEDIEFSKLNASINEVMRNMFVFTADETGIQRRERLMNIEPEGQWGLEERRMYLLAVMNRRKMSLSEIEKMLASYSNGIRLVPDYQEGKLNVFIEQHEKNADMLYEILDNIMPMDIFVEMIHERIASSLLIHCGGIMEQADIINLKQR